MKRFWPYFRLLKPVRFQFAVGLLFGALNGVANGFGLPYATQKVLPALFGDPTPTNWTMVAYLSVLPAAFLVRGVTGFANAYLMRYCGIRVQRALRVQVYSKIQHLPIQNFHGWKAGDLMVRILGDTTNIQKTLTTTANAMIRQPVTFIGAMGSLVYLSFLHSEVVFVLVCLALVPLMVVPVRFIGRKLLSKAQRVRRQAGQVSTCVQENMLATKEIRLFNLQQSQITAFADLLERMQKYQMQNVKYSNVLGPSIELLSAIGISVAMFYAVNSGVTLEQIAPLIVALYMSYQPLRRFGQIHNSLKAGEASLDRVEKLLKRRSGLVEPEHPRPLVRARGEIEFRDVVFRYGEPEVLKGVSDRIAPGEIVALVGQSGAGKTTFANLVPRLYDARSGQVLVDGVDVRQYLKHDLREQIALVPQDPILFNDTIRSNILIGRQDATEEQMTRASKQAYAHDFIVGFPDGYDTLVGDRGTRMSGGQRQRIAIARAFLKDAPMLILDEATSNLDSESESMIQAALAKLAEGRTTIIIAHRFSTLKIAHRILVFEEGRIVATGSHDELYAGSPRYRTLYEHQL